MEYEIIQLRVDKYEKENIERIKKDLGISYTDLILPAFIETLDENEEELKKHMKKNNQIKAYMNSRTTLTKDIGMTYHFSNAIERLLILAGKRMNYQDEAANNINAVLHYTVEKTLDSYELLPDDIKELLKPEQKSFQKLLLPNGIINFCKQNNFRINRSPFKNKKLVGKR